MASKMDSEVYTARQEARCKGKEIKTATFNNKQYRIMIDDLDGNCDTDNYLWLIIERDLSKRVGLETAIHEALHACRWRAKEDEVTITARDIARFLWRLGFRREINNG